MSTIVLLLRIASVLSAIQGLAHGALFITAKPRNGPAEEAVVSAMKATRVMRGGLGYWDFYFGYGLIAAAICIVEAVLFWQLVTVARANPALARPTIALFVVWNIAHALLLVRYFRFPVPITFDVVIAITLALAFFAARPAAN